MTDEPSTLGPARDREDHAVELVDEKGTAIGAMSVRDAHSGAGKLHRAFSVMLADGSGRVLLQRRSLTKHRFAGRWSNTCCGHPAPGQSLVEAAQIRLAEEVGVLDVPLEGVGTFVYSAADRVSGLVEREFDHVLVGRYEDTPMDLNADEVCAVRWHCLDSLIEEVSITTAETYTPWLGAVCRLTADFIDSRLH
jgi:isopentenyl-diphosphate delta-isomerase